MIQSPLEADQSWGLPFKADLPLNGKDRSISLFLVCFYVSWHWAFSVLLLASMLMRKGCMEWAWQELKLQQGKYRSFWNTNKVCPSQAKLLSIKMCKSVPEQGYFTLCRHNIDRTMEANSIGFGDAGRESDAVLLKMDRKIAGNKIQFSATSNCTVTLWEKRGGLNPCVRAWQGCTLKQGLQSQQHNLPCVSTTVEMFCQI